MRMHTKNEIKEVFKEDPEKAYYLMIDFIDTILDSDQEKIDDLRDEWNSEVRLASLFEYDQEINEGDFFGKYDKWEEEHGYKCANI